MFGVFCDYYSSKLKANNINETPHQKVTKLKSKLSLTLG